jgi:hypothetical protein
MKTLKMMMGFAVLAILVMLLIGCPDGGPGGGVVNPPTLENFLAGEVQQVQNGGDEPQFNIQIQVPQNVFSMRSARSIKGARAANNLDLPSAGAVYALEGDFFIPPELLPDGATEGIVLPMEGSYDDESGKFLASAATEDLRYTVSGIFDANGELVGDPIISVAERDGEEWVPEVFLSKVGAIEEHPVEPLDPEEGGLPRELQGRWSSSYSTGGDSRNELHLMASPWFIDTEATDTRVEVDKEGNLTATAETIHEQWTILSVEPNGGGYDVILSSPNYYNVDDQVYADSEAAFYAGLGITIPVVDMSDTDAFMAALESGEPFIGDGMYFNNMELMSQYYASGGLVRYMIENDIPPGHTYQKVNLSVSGNTFSWKSYSKPGYQGVQHYLMDNLFDTLAEAESVNAIGEGFGDKDETGRSTGEFQKKFYKVIPDVVELPLADPANYELVGGVPQPADVADGTLITLSGGTSGASIYYDPTNNHGPLLEEWIPYTEPFALAYNGAAYTIITVLAMKDGMYSNSMQLTYENSSQQYAVTEVKEVTHTEDGDMFEGFFNLGADGNFFFEPYLSAGPVTLRYASIANAVKAVGEISLVITKTNGGEVIPHTGDWSGFTFTMPAEPITISISGTFQPVGYKVTVSTIGSVMINSSLQYAEEGDTVYLQVMDMEDVLESIKVINDTTGDEIPLSEPVEGEQGMGLQYNFTMPASSVTVEVETSGNGGFPGGGGDYLQIDTQFNVSNGSIMSDDQGQGKQEGDTVTLSIMNTPASRLKEESIKVTKADDETEEVVLSGPNPGMMPDEILYTFTMPGYNVTVYAEFESAYEIDANTYIGTGGTVQTNSSSAFAGDTVTLTVMGGILQYGSFKVVKSDDESVEVELSDPVVGDLGDEYTFTMPEYDVIVHALFEGGGDPNLPGIYAIDTMTNITGGMIAADPTTADEGETVTLSVTMGKVLDGTLKVVKADGSDEEVSVNGPVQSFMGDEYTFTMPGCDVTVHAEFEQAFNIDTFANVTGDGIIQPSPFGGQPEGTTVTLTIMPNLGFQLKDGSLKVVKAADDSDVSAEVGLSGPTEGWGGIEYTFTMPAYNVEIHAEFEAAN